MAKAREAEAEAEMAAAWDAHPYYQLLPSYVTRSSVEAERQALFQRVEVRNGFTRRVV